MLESIFAYVENEVRLDDKNNLNITPKRACFKIPLTEQKEKPIGQLARKHEISVLFEFPQKSKHGPNFFTLGQYNTITWKDDEHTDNGMLDADSLLKILAKELGYDIKKR